MIKLLIIANQYPGKYLHKIQLVNAGDFTIFSFKRAGSLVYGLWRGCRLACYYLWWVCRFPASAYPVFLHHTCCFRTRTWFCYLVPYLKEAMTTISIIRYTYCTFKDICTWMACCLVLMCLGAGLFYPYLLIFLRWHWSKHTITPVAMKQPRRISLHWRHNGLDGVSNHQPYHCLHSRLFERRSKKTAKLRVSGPCAGNSPGTGEFHKWPVTRKMFPFDDVIMMGT